MPWPRSRPLSGTCSPGQWLLHLLGGGHYVVIGLAWLPLVLLWLEDAIRKGSFRAATAAGAVFGLLILGTQPQWTFYAGLFIGAWSFGAVLERARRNGWLRRAAPVVADY